MAGILKENYEHLQSSKMVKMTQINIKQAPLPPRLFLSASLLAAGNLVRL